MVVELELVPHILLLVEEVVVEVTTEPEEVRVEDLVVDRGERKDPVQATDAVEKLELDMLTPK